MFKIIFFERFLNGWVALYNTVAFHDLGLAIIFLTLIIRIIFLPLFYKSAKNQILIQRLQPEIQKIQHDHKDNKEKQAQAMMELYKKHQVNPFSGFLMLLVQLPVLIAIYQVFLQEFSPAVMDRLYSFVTSPTEFNALFLGLLDLEKRSILMVGLAAIMQYLQGKLSLPAAEKGREPSPAEKIGRQMVFIGPVLTIVILSNLPAAVGLYWLITSVFSVVQQIYINKTLNISQEKKEHGLTQTKTE